MRWLVVAALAACTTYQPPRVPRDGPAALASTFTYMGGDVLELALWPNGDVVYEDAAGRHHGRIDPAHAREILEQTAARVARLPDEIRLSNGTDLDIARIAIRTRDGYRVVAVYSFMFSDIAPKAAFVDAYVTLLAARPADAPPLAHELRHEDAVLDLLWQPGMHLFTAHYFDTPLGSSAQNRPGPPIRPPSSAASASSPQ